MKKSLYLFLCLFISCLSFDFSRNGYKGHNRNDGIIEEQGKTSLILKPFKFMGLLWSCTPDEEPGGGGGSHQSHRSHSSHYSSR